VQAAVKKMEKFGYGVYIGIRPGDVIHLDGGTVKVTGISREPDPAAGERTVSFESTTSAGVETFALAPVTQKDLKYCTLWVRHGVDERGIVLEVLDSPSQGSPYQHTRCGGPLPAAAAQTPRAKTQTPSRTPASRQPRPAAGLPN
jgi:hypothetical protein